MTARGSQRGDLVIRLSRHSAPLYVIETEGDSSTPQLACTTYEEAVRRATQTAERAHLDVWYADGTTFERIARYRRSS